MSKPTSFCWRKALRERICPVCRLHVPEGEGVIHAPLTVVIHDGKCNDLATSCYRDYRHSKRGRWRGNREVRPLILQLLEKK